MENWKMSYSGPVVMLRTAYGTVQATFTRADHAHVTAHWSHDDGIISYRDRLWEVAMHLWADLGWSEKTSGPYGQKPFRQVDDLKREAAPTYRKAIAEAVENTVRAYAEAHPEVLQAAEVNHLEHDLKHATADRDAKAEAYRQALAEVAQISRQLEEARKGSDR